MKRIYYNSRVAKTLLRFSACHSITVGPFLFTKLTKESMPKNVLTHESCHALQWTEMTFATAFIVSIVHLFIGLPIGLVAISPFAYYVWYGIEMLIRRSAYENLYNSWCAVSFEQEATMGELYNDYILNRQIFGWFKYIKKRLSC